MDVFPAVDQWQLMGKWKAVPFHIVSIISGGELVHWAYHGVILTDMDETG